MTEPFRFSTSIKLPEFVGRRAGTVAELLEGIRAVDGSSIFHHTYNFLYQHHAATPSPASDFAYWVGQILLDHDLAERLAAVNPVEFPSIRALRERMISVFEEHRAVHDCTTHAPDGMYFYFMRTNSVVLPLGLAANDLASFAAAVERIPLGSIYHHMFEARLRLEGDTNDFSRWIGEGLSRPELARRIAGMDPCLLTLDQVRARILGFVRAEEGRR